jgi:hypothetical protein
VTLFFSQDTISTIMHVIPTMDRIDALLNNTAAEPLSLSVKHVLAFARQIINRYYSKTDLLNVVTSTRERMGWRPLDRGKFMNRLCPIVCSVPHYV